MAQLVHAVIQLAMAVDMPLSPWYDYGTGSWLSPVLPNALCGVVSAILDMKCARPPSGAQQGWTRVVAKGGGGRFHALASVSLIVDRQLRWEARAIGRLVLEAWRGAIGGAKVPVASSPSVLVSGTVLKVTQANHEDNHSILDELIALAKTEKEYVQHRYEVIAKFTQLVDEDPGLECASEEMRWAARCAEGLLFGPPKWLTAAGRAEGPSCDRDVVILRQPKSIFDLSLEEMSRSLRSSG